MSQNAIQIIERLKEKLHLKYDKELCKALDIKQNTLSTWKKRDSLDFNKIIAICESETINLDYIFFGIESSESSITNSEETIEEDMESKSPKAEVLKEFKLVNTNRNIGLFTTTMKCNPNIDENLVVVGQKIKKNTVSENVTYVIEFMTKGFVIDELILISEGLYKMKYCHECDMAIQPKKHIRNLWQVIDNVEVKPLLS